MIIMVKIIKDKKKKKKIIQKKIVKLVLICCEPSKLKTFYNEIIFELDKSLKQYKAMLLATSCKDEHIAQCF